jgi:hypothetical protein
MTSLSAHVFSAIVNLYVKKTEDRTVTLAPVVLHTVVSCSLGKMSLAVKRPSGM